MLAFLTLVADFARWCAHPATRPPISATHPRPAVQSPEPHCQGSGQKRFTSRPTVSGAVAWGRGKPSPAHCTSTAHKPPTHHAPCRRHAPPSIACRCAPRRNPHLVATTISCHKLVNVVV